ncbi:MAG: hypothetical protein EOO41_02960, partial [Methanobacteriota archaeon]
MEWKRHTTSALSPRQLDALAHWPTLDEWLTQLAHFHTQSEPNTLRGLLAGWSGEGVPLGLAACSYFSYHKIAAPAAAATDADAVRAAALHAAPHAGRAFLHTERAATAVQLLLLVTLEHAIRDVHAARDAVAAAFLNEAPTVSCTATAADYLLASTAFRLLWTPIVRAQYAERFCGHAQVERVLHAWEQELVAAALVPRADCALRIEGGDHGIPTHIRPVIQHVLRLCTWYAIAQCEPQLVVDPAWRVLRVPAVAPPSGADARSTHSGNERTSVTTRSMDAAAESNAAVVETPFLCEVDAPAASVAGATAHVRAATARFDRSQHACLYTDTEAKARGLRSGDTAYVVGFDWRPLQRAEHPAGYCATLEADDAHHTRQLADDAHVRPYFAHLRALACRERPESGTLRAVCMQCDVSCVSQAHGMDERVLVLPGLPAVLAPSGTGEQRVLLASAASVQPRASLPSVAASHVEGESGDLVTPPRTAGQHHASRSLSFSMTSSPQRQWLSPVLLRTPLACACCGSLLPSGRIRSGSFQLAAH